MSERKRKYKRDFEKRQEKALEMLAFLSLFYLALSVLATSFFLIIFRQADLILPFKMLIIMGFAYLLTNSYLSVIFHIKKRKFQNPQLLCLKVVASIASSLAMVYSLPSALALSAVIRLDFSFDASILLAFGVGAFAAVVGMVLSFKRLL